jgi:hypothetical protein
MSSDPSNKDDDLTRIQTRIAARKQGQQPALSMEAVLPEPAPVSPSQKQPTKEPARTHPDKRGQVMLSNLLTELQGGKPQEGPEISYYSPELIQCTLPHSDPKANHWIRKNGHYALIVQSGIDSEGNHFGVPYGSFPRLVLAHIITRVVATHERRIELSSHFGRFLKEVGYVGDHRGDKPSGRRIRDQLIRLLRASITFEYKEGSALQGRYSAADIKVAPKFDLWWDFKNKEQDSLFGSWIELSEDFHRAILNSPVPLSTEVLKALKKSPLAIDVYMWASYRLFSMQANNRDQLHVTFGQLQGQFGTGIAEENYRQFRDRLKDAFAKVAAHWHAPNSKDRSLLNHEFTEDGLTLYSSPLLVGRGHRVARVEQMQKIITDRRFDEDTRKKARLIAGNWNVSRLEADYWTWLEHRNFTPSNPTAHFLDFIKRHRRRNGETV